MGKNLADWLELDFDRDGMTASSQLDVTSIDDDVDAAGMTDATRESLDTFYNPYTAQLYALMVKEGVTFIDVIERRTCSSFPGGYGSPLSLFLDIQHPHTT